MSIEYQDLDDDVREIRIQGRFDFSVYSQFLAAFRDTDGTRTRYEIDLRGTEYIDSAALGMLMLLREHAGNDGKRVILRSPKPKVREILAIANFNRLFHLDG